MSLYIYVEFGVDVKHPLFVFLVISHYDIMTLMALRSNYERRVSSWPFSPQQRQKLERERGWSYLLQAVLSLIE